MSELAEILGQYGAEYRVNYEARMLPSHKKAMQAIEQCRTEALGGHLYRCESCQVSQYSYHSCGNRHCPKCQHQAGQLWLEKQQQLLLPVPYFMVTFTLPQPLRAIARSNQRLIYDLLFRTAAAALQELGQDRRFVGGQLGLVGVLQTWKRDLSYHPHLHFIVPGGGLGADGAKWLASRKNFLVPVKALSKLLRGKFGAGLKKSDLYGQVPQQVWQQEWVVNAIRVGNGQAALKYVAPYIFGVALSNKRIIKVAEGKVTFGYRPSGSKKYQTLTLPAEQFIHRFLQHILPKGFVKVRY